MVRSTLCLDKVDGAIISPSVTLVVDGERDTAKQRIHTGSAVKRQTCPRVVVPSSTRTPSGLKTILCAGHIVIQTCEVNQTGGSKYPLNSEQAEAEHSATILLAPKAVPTKSAVDRACGLFVPRPLENVHMSALVFFAFLTIQCYRGLSPRIFPTTPSY